LAELLIKINFVPFFPVHHLKATPKLTFDVVGFFGLNGFRFLCVGCCLFVQPAATFVVVVSFEYLVKISPRQVPFVIYSVSVSSLWVP